MWVASIVSRGLFLLLPFCFGLVFLLGKVRLARACDPASRLFLFLFCVVLFCFGFVLFWKCVQAEVCLRRRIHGLEPPRNVFVEEDRIVCFLLVVRRTKRHEGSFGTTVSMGWFQSVYKFECNPVWEGIGLQCSMYSLAFCSLVPTRYNI